MGLEALLDVVTISEEVGVRKLAPEIFHQTLAQIEVEPGHAVFVGDNPLVRHPWGTKGRHDFGLEAHPILAPATPDRRGNRRARRGPVLGD